MSDPKDETKPSFLPNVQFRPAAPTDILQCFQLESSWNENASKNDLQYRQHHAANFFRCAVIEAEDEEDVIIGFICSTRIEAFQEDNISTMHRPNGTILMIHSMVIDEKYRRHGLGSIMLQDYLESLRSTPLKHPVSELMVFATKEFLTFFLHAGFSVVRPLSKIEEEKQKYLLRMPIESPVYGKECYVVDSFAATAGTGNPAAVVILPVETDEEQLETWMQMVAAEFNLSETAFCWPLTESRNSQEELHWNIRFFTPTMQVDLCGHATLASASILFQRFQPKPDCKIIFHALKDELTVELADSAENMSARQRRICMEFPSRPPTEITADDDKTAIVKMLDSAFSCQMETLYMGLSEIGDILVEVTPESFQKIGYDKLNYDAFLEYEGYPRGVIVCCVTDRNVDDMSVESSAPVPDFFSRFFGPKAGIYEDPVTGSAHCVLGPYFAAKLSKDVVIGQQMSKRGGFVECMVVQDSVKITGTAITTLTGTQWV